LRTVFLEMERLRHPATGLGQFCLHLGRQFIVQDTSDLDLRFFLPSSRRTLFGTGRKYVIQHGWHKLFIPGSSQYDVWHCFHQDSKYLPRSKSRVLLTIHDLNFLSKYSGPKQVRRLKRLQDRVFRSSGIAVDSHFTGSILRENVEVGNIPVKVIQLGNSLTHFRDPKRPASAPSGRFFLALGVLSPRKNFHVLPAILKSFPGCFLLIAGPGHPEYARVIRDEAGRHGVLDRVIFAGEIGDEDRFWYYRNCEALLFPSLAEGFGLPAVEAMSLGKPVFLSRLTSLPEVGGEQAFYFDDFDPAHMREVVERGLHRAATEAGFPAKLIEHSRKWSWEEAARRYLEFYRTV
jgi:glycosyltransferase involved in cell wall biosynthesis